jgi:hypothetical protein
MGLIYQKRIGYIRKELEIRDLKNEGWDFEIWVVKMIPST